MPITPHESVAIHLLPYNRLRASRGGVAAADPHDRNPPQRRSRGPGRPAQPRAAHLFLPRALEHSGKPANGSRGREIQRSTSCNPRILQGRGMFDGKAFLKVGVVCENDPKNVFENWYPSVFFGDPNT